MSDDTIKNIFSVMQERADNISKYSDKLRMNLAEFDGILENFNAGIEVFETTPFYREIDDAGFEYLYHWYFDNAGLWIKKNGYEDGVGKMESIDLRSVARNILVLSVKTLIPFLKTNSQRP